MRLFSLAPFLLLLFLGVPAYATAQDSSSLDELTLRPGDIVRVVIWREPDLGGDFQVTVKGTLVLPLLGEWRATAKTWAHLEAELLGAYRRELENPSVSLTPFRTVFVLGEANNPGLYNLPPTNTTVGGALALAGGITEQGDVENIRLSRDGREIPLDVTRESDLMAQEVLSGDQIIVGRKSWFERNNTFLISALLSTTTILVTLLAR